MLIYRRELSEGASGRRRNKVDGPFPRVVPGRLLSDLGKMNEFLDLNLLESFQVSCWLRP